MFDLTAHLEHLQSILLKYNPIGAPTEPILLRYFWKDLRPSILAKLQNEDLEQKCFVQIIKKAVVPKANVNLQPWATIQEIDQQYY